MRRFPSRCQGLAGGFLSATRPPPLHRPPNAPVFGAVTGSAASEGVFASSLDVRWTRTSALDLPPRKAPLTPPPAAAPLADAPLRGRSSPRCAWAPVGTHEYVAVFMKRSTSCFSES